MGTAASTDIHKYYKIHEKLGFGSFAVVKRAVRKADKAQFAVKEIKKSSLDEKEMETVMDEVSIMRELDHPNCVKLIDMFESPKKVYMVLELLTGGELFDRIVKKGNFTEREASEVMKTLTGAIQYLHGKKIVHRDLKPENLLYSSPSDDAQIKVTDFGLAKATSKDKVIKMHTACGTPGYVAPEVLRSRPYGPAVDMWSLGVILYILLCGFPPFYHQDTTELYKLIKTGKYEFPNPWWQNISDGAKDLVTKLLTLEPAKRATPDDVLKHPWISNDQSTVPLQNIKGLQLLQAKLKLRKGIKSIIAINRFVDALENANRKRGESD